MNKDIFVYSWYKNRNLIIALLILLFPLGWYDMFKGEHFSKKIQLYIFNCPCDLDFYPDYGGQWFIWL